MSSAQPCGYGPVSKLVAVAAALGPGRLDFVGTGVSLDFARRHQGHFNQVRPGDTADERSVAPHLATTDLVISVMDAELVFWAVRAGRPVLFFDSLLGFWATSRTPAQLAEVAEVVRDRDPAAARSAFDGLSPHERILVAHLLADRSFAQNFPGVPARIAELAEVGADHIQLTGPIIDNAAVRSALAAAPPEDPADLLVNLGGFKNFYLDYDSHNAYLDVLRRWVLDLAGSTGDLEHVIVCCGGFSRPETVRVGRTRVDFTCLPHQEFLRQMAFAPLYAVPPSLTSLHEAVLVRRMPWLLPEQHYGHIVNRRMLAGTAVARHAASMRRLGPQFQVPEDDFDGTRELDRLTRLLAGDEKAYQGLRSHLDDSLAAYRALDPERRAAAVDELVPLLDGPPLTELLADVDTVALASAGDR
ncbi:hypothetical protein GCM10010185_57230 [Saccharothrix coeruleofusca]|uniref:Uncharacterized protein n=1 Tax=Saccharothrix coeruleofusca TaxID=33919 RepID=A0A918EHG6_9PSEU|nr:hypothetical protein GCM10010185_57230 [Saccharothrix coeruleofusca]